MLRNMHSKSQNRQLKLKSLSPVARNHGGCHKSGKIIEPWTYLSIINTFHTFDKTYMV